MKITLLLVLLFSALAYCCTPPFNNFTLIDNSTLLEEAIAQYNNRSQLDDATQVGRAHIVGDPSPIKTWPKNQYGLSIVKFCYADECARNKLEDTRYQAWQIWSNKIKNAGSGSGHRLGGFQEVKSPRGNPVYCFTDRKNKVWIPIVPTDTLLIDVNINSIGYYDNWASTGYVTSDWDNKPCWHRMQLGWFNHPIFDKEQVIWTATHEMGHVFGFSHEHQRPDRDRYVEFQCRNIPGYGEALYELQRHHGLTIDKLCVSSMLTRMSPWNNMNFAPYSFSKEPDWNMEHRDKDGNLDGEQHKFEVVKSMDYDTDSIMHYDSRESHQAHLPKTVGWTPLMKWKKGGPNYNGPTFPTVDTEELIADKPWSGGPSDGDAVSLGGIRSLMGVGFVSTVLDQGFIGMRG